jgi:cytochrome c-type biogenesis protein CcmE
LKVDRVKPPRLVRVKIVNVMDDEGRTQATPVGHRAGWLRRKRFLLVGLAVAIALGYLGFTAFQGASMYYLTVDELLARNEAAYGERVRLIGKVEEGSVVRNSETNTLHFAMADEDGTSLPVVHSGAVPDAFKEGADVVAEGSLARAGMFQADSLLVKCPSKYEAAPEDQVKEGGD